MKRIFSILLCLLMLVVMPVTAYASSKCTTKDNHSIACGNMGKWFSTRSELQSYADTTITTLKNKWNNNEVEASEVPYGYECWSCSSCGKWTGNFKYNEIKNGFVTENGHTYYYKDNEKLLWRQKIDNKWYYFNGNGEMQVGKQKIDGKWYIFSKSDGHMVTGRVLCDGKYYICSKLSGELCYGKVRCDGRYYIMSKFNGQMCYGKVQCDGKTYIMSKSNGQMCYGKVRCDGKYYICSKSTGEVIKNRWVQCDGKKYHTDKNGVCLNS